MHEQSDAFPHVVILGGGFGGLHAAIALRRAPVRITLLDRNNHHLFSPLLYQVATASLSPADIAHPIRWILRKQRNTRVLLAEARSIDPDRRVVILADGEEVPYDWLIVATGAVNNYYGHDDWAGRAPGLKEIDDAIEIRRRFLLAFESAERERDATRRRDILTFVIIGGGPTGVELAGAMAEIARRAMPTEFRAIDTATARIMLLEGGPRLLPTFDEGLSERARRDLETLGVEVRLNSPVTAIDDEGLTIGGSGERIATKNVFWAAGVSASPIAASLGAPTDRGGRILVNPDLSVPGRAEVLVIGDLANVNDARTGLPVPAVAPAAMQMGRHAARIIAREVRMGATTDAASSRLGGASGLHPPSRRVRTTDPAVFGGSVVAPRPPFRPAFRYVDKGMLATIGRAKAVGTVGRLRFAGYVAWVVWLVVHIVSLIGFRSRLIVLIQWAWAYFRFERGARLITGLTRGAEPPGSPRCRH